MKFLMDQDAYGVTTAFLRGLGHDVQTAEDRAMATAPDGDLLRVAQAEGRVFVTRDRDLGELVFT